MAAGLGLKAASPFHSFRSVLHFYGATLTSLCVTLGKMAGDMMLLMQAEVGEVSEGFKQGRGGSSAMAHKRNPALSTLIKASALEAPPLLSALYMSGFGEHERAGGAWQTEWLTLPLLVKLTASALQKSVMLYAELEVYPARMLENYETYLAPVLSEKDKSIDSAVLLAQNILINTP
jgi:3-carboxy-cis,cis-muconate cycloisomerase